jgi:hypothetical protein
VYVVVDESLLDAGMPIQGTYSTSTLVPAGTWQRSIARCTIGLDG